MNIRATLLAGVLGVPFLAGATLAADTGRLSLTDAAKSGNRDAVRSLLSEAAKEDLAGPVGTSALLEAAARNDVEMTELLLRAGADPKAANEFGATALYAGAANRDPAVITKLLAAGADPNKALDSGETPLMLAARDGNLATLRALLDAGADPNVHESNGGQTALMWAAAEKHPGIVEELIRRKADVNARSKNGSTPLMFAAQGDAKSAGILLAGGANPNDHAPDTGLTALIIASTMGRIDVVKVLLENAADPNAADDNSFTPLHAAVRDNDYGEDHVTKTTGAQIVKLLLAHGANPNARLHQEKPTIKTATEVNLEGATPVLLAAEVNNLEAMKALVAGGADPRIATAQGTTALILASGAGTDVQRTRTLEERATALDTAKFLVEHGVDVNAAGQFGWTALHSATYQGLNPVVEYLVAKGAKIDAFDKLGQTPLSISLSVLTKDAGAKRLQIPRRYRKDTAELLLKLGATPLAKSGVVVVLQRNGDLADAVGE
jgi:ankyrin repeat protein